MAMAFCLGLLLLTLTLITSFTQTFYHLL
uniref:Uncharacterized protein n=1 Tax=Rhizophora mucronata TaxID=61149 RepID=A0A2P2QES5_RHIMU